MPPKVSIIILNWNGWKDTIECLESLYQISYSNYDVVVVDNGSSDDSIEKIKKYCEGKIQVKSKFFKYTSSNKPIYVLEYTRDEAEKGGNFRKEKYFSKLPSNRKIRLILNEKNYGFAEGNNIAMRYVLKALNPDYVLLLNNDTVVDSIFLDELVKIAESDGRIGIVGSKIYYYENPEKVWHSFGIINLWNGVGYGIEDQNTNLDPKNLHIPLYLSGCSMLIKRHIIQKLKGFDAIWFAYYEDADLCFKAQKIGYKCVYACTSKIYHKVSSGTKNVKGIQLYYFTRNRILFMFRWAPKLNKYIFISSSVILFPLILVREILRNRIKHLDHIIMGFIDAYNFKFENK